jgi:hypothetical protein
MDLLNGVHCATIANVNRGKNTPPFSADQFRIFAAIDRKKSKPEEIAAMMNRRVSRQNEVKDRNG